MDPGQLSNVLKRLAEERLVVESRGRVKGRSLKVKYYTLSEPGQKVYFARSAHAEIGKSGETTPPIPQLQPALFAITTMRETYLRRVGLSDLPFALDATAVPADLGPRTMPMPLVRELVRATVPLTEAMAGGRQRLDILTSGYRFMPDAAIGAAILGLPNPSRDLLLCITDPRALELGLWMHSGENDRLFGSNTLEGRARDWLAEIRNVRRVQGASANPAVLIGSPSHPLELDVCVRAVLANAVALIDSGFTVVVGLPQSLSGTVATIGKRAGVPVRFHAWEGLKVESISDAMGQLAADDHRLLSDRLGAKLVGQALRFPHRVTNYLFLRKDGTTPDQALFRVLQDEMELSLQYCAVRLGWDSVNSPFLLADRKHQLHAILRAVVSGADRDALTVSPSEAGEGTLNVDSRSVAYALIDEGLLADDRTASLLYPVDLLPIVCSIREAPCPCPGAVSRSDWEAISAFAESSAGPSHREHDT